VATAQLKVKMDESARASRLSEGSVFDTQISTKDLMVFEESLTGLRAVLCRAFNSYVFDLTMSSLIMLNLVLVVLDTDLRVEGHSVPFWLVGAQYTLLAAFLIECSIRLYTYQGWFFRSGWNILDMVILSVDVGVEVISMVASGKLAFNFSVLRTLRLIRVLRALRFLGGSKELWMMLHGMSSALKAIAWSVVLIGLFLVIWAIVAVEILHPLNVAIAGSSNIYDQCPRCHRAFASVGEATLTFTQQIIAGDSWGTTSMPLMEAHPWTSFIFLSVLVSVDLGLLNLITAVIVDRAWEARQEDIQRQLQDRSDELDTAKKRLRKFYSEMDEDSSGTLSLAEILGGYDENVDFQNAMKVMDITRDDISIVFNMIDSDGSGEVNFEEFLHGLTKMKSENAHTLLMFIKFYVQECRHSLADQMKFLHGTLDRRTADLEKRFEDLWGLMVRGLSDSVPPRTHSDNNYAFQSQFPEKATPPDKLGLMSSLDLVLQELGALRQQMDSELFDVLKAVSNRTEQRLDNLFVPVPHAASQSRTRAVETISSEPEVLQKKADYSAPVSAFSAPISSFSAPISSFGQGSACCGPAQRVSPERWRARTTCGQGSSLGS